MYHSYSQSFTRGHFFLSVHRSRPICFIHSAPLSRGGLPQIGDAALTNQQLSCSVQQPTCYFWPFFGVWPGFDRPWQGRKAKIIAVHYFGCGGQKHHHEASPQFQQQARPANFIFFLVFVCAKIIRHFILFLE